MTSDGLRRVETPLCPLLATGDAPAEGAVTVAVRPERITLHRAPPGGPNTLTGTLAERVFLGDRTALRVLAADGTGLRVSLPAGAAGLDGLNPGDPVHLAFAPEAARVLTA